MGDRYLNYLIKNSRGNDFISVGALPMGTNGQSQA